MGKYDISQKIVFKTGTYELNSDANFNYQFNRVIMWDGGDADEVMAVSHSIKTSSDWASTMEQLAEKAHAEGRTVNEIAYLRMSEFFIYGTDPKKKKRYQEACDLFYDYYSEYFDKGIVQRHKVTYCGGYLSVMVTKAKGSCKGGILLHGSNDSYYLVHPLVYILRPVRLHLTNGSSGLLVGQYSPIFYAVICDHPKPVRDTIDFMFRMGMDVPVP